MQNTPNAKGESFNNNVIVIKRVELEQLKTKLIISHIRLFCIPFISDRKKIFNVQVLLGKQQDGNTRNVISSSNLRTTRRNAIWNNENMSSVLNARRHICISLR